MLIALLLGGSLVNNPELFIHSSQAAHFSYLIGASILLIAGAACLALRGEFTSFKVPLPLLTIIAFGLYVFLHGLAVTNKINHRHIYLIVSCWLCLTIYLVYQMGMIRLSDVLWLVTALAIAEALLCIAQFAGWVASENTFFKVTGSWVNPNVTAMFLAMSFPAVLGLCLTNPGRVKQVAISSAGILIVAIILLQCRTAYIGAAASWAAMLSYRYNFLKSTRSKANRSGAIVLGMLLLVILVPFASYLYQLKKDSAEGRKLIWKISAEMIARKPLTGYGYGRFEHDYNLIQARQVESGLLSEKDLKRADHVKMAYNEYLENAAEGGIIGLALLSAIFIFC